MTPDATGRLLPRRAISVRQPWAWAILSGGKRVENRSRRDPWRNAIGERLYLHAAKTVETCDYSAVGRLAGAMPPHELPLGALVGLVTVRDVHSWRLCDNTRHMCSPWAQDDQFHIVLADVEPLAEPVPYRGALGLFEVTL